MEPIRRVRPMLRQAASRIAHGALVGSGTARVFRHLNRSKLAILMYHGLHAGEADPLVNFDGMYLHVQRFERQMRYLARHCRVVPLEQRLDPADGPLRVAVTFDDGYASTFHHAYPILKSLGLPATVFVATDFVERPTMMWWDRLRLAIHATRELALTVQYGDRHERFSTASSIAKAATLDRLIARLRHLAPAERHHVLDALDGGEISPSIDRSLYEPLTLEHMRAMVDHGISFQSHGISHNSFGALSTEEIGAELRESKATLERWFGRSVTWFAYPFGDRDPRARDPLTRAGYEGAVSCRETLSQPDDDRFAIPRIAVGDPISLPQFVVALSGVRAAVGRVKRALRMEPVA